MKKIKITSYIKIFVLAPFLILLFSGCGRLVELKQFSDLLTLKTKYVSFSCGDRFPRLVELTDTKKPETEKKPVFLYLPSDILNPEESAAAVPGNIFFLTGYRLNLLVSEKSNGKIIKNETNHFYLLSWKAQTPYKVWDNNKEMPVTTEINEPLQDSSKEKKLNFKNFISVNDPCL